MSEKLMSEFLPVVATVDPDANGTGAHSTDSVDMQKYRKAMFVVLAGIIASSGTLDFKLQEGITTTAWQDVTGKSITQFTTGDNDKQAIINVEQAELSAGYRYVKGVMTLTTAGADSAVVALGYRGRFTDAATSTSYGDLSTVDEIVA